VNAEAQGIDPQASARPADRIMAAARQLFFTNGYANTQLRAIASLAGTSETGILRAFSSKAGLLLAVYGWSWRRINTRVRTELEKSARVDADPRHLLTVIVRCLLDLYDEEHQMMAFIVSNYNSVYDPRNVRLASFIPSANLQPFTDAFYEHVAIVDDLCAQAVSKGLAPEGVTARALREFVLAIPHGVHQGWLMAEQDETASPKVTTGEVTALVKSYLYAPKA
jgi:AcrR family transcriptional regulator